MKTSLFKTLFFQQNSIHLCPDILETHKNNIRKCPINTTEF
jgi:hypothetical protein